MNKKHFFVLLIILLICAVFVIILIDFSKETPPEIISEKNLNDTENTDEKNNAEENQQEEITDTNKTYYFGYGSNMDIDLLRRRINNDSIVPESYAILENYKLIFPRGVGSVISENNFTVYGCLFLLTDEELSRLDIVEGYSPGRDRSLNTYNREQIEILLPDGNILFADIYIQVQTTEDKPSSTYLQTIIKGANDCNLPEEYIEYIEKIETR